MWGKSKRRCTHGIEKKGRQKSYVGKIEWFSSRTVHLFVRGIEFNSEMIAFNDVILFILEMLRDVKCIEDKMWHPIPSFSYVFRIKLNFPYCMNTP